MPYSSTGLPSPHDQSRQASPSYMSAFPSNAPTPSSSSQTTEQSLHAYTLSHGTNASSTDTVTDPMYASLPAYRFPAGPSRSGSAPSHQSSPALVSSGFTFPMKTRLPEAPVIHDQQDNRMRFSPDVSPVPSLQTCTSTLSSASRPLLKSALPIVAFEQMPISEDEIENIYPSGMVTQLDHSYSLHPQPQSYHHGNGMSSSNQWALLSPAKMSSAVTPAAPQTPHKGEVYNSSTRFNVEYSPLQMSPTTYLPSSAYLPSTATFAGPSMSMDNYPRSAPSTPLGRQDARFVSRQGWQPQTLPNPFPMSAPYTEPRMRTNLAPPLQSYYGSPAMPQNAGYYSADEFDRDASPLYMSIDSNRSPRLGGSPYIPYARSATKTVVTPTKRSPRPVDLAATPGKKVRRTQDTQLGNAALSYSTDSALSDAKSKAARCKIACGACRKTRLRCTFFFFFPLAITDISSV
jgi:hypothetical protein